MAIKQNRDTTEEKKDIIWLMWFLSFWNFNEWDGEFSRSEKIASFDWNDDESDRDNFLLE